MDYIIITYVYMLFNELLNRTASWLIITEPFGGRLIVGGAEEWAAVIYTLLSLAGPR